MGAAELVDLLKTTEFVVGLLVSVTSALVGLVVWFHRRMRDVATEVNDEARGPREEMAKRLGELERDMRDTRGEVHALAGRVGGVERTLETVARQKDLALLGAQMGEFTYNQLSAEVGLSPDTIRTICRAWEKDGKPHGASSSMTSMHAGLRDRSSSSWTVPLALRQPSSHSGARNCRSSAARFTSTAIFWATRPSTCMTN